MTPCTKRFRQHESAFSSLEQAMLAALAAAMIAAAATSLGRQLDPTCQFLKDQLTLAVQ